MFTTAFRSLRHRNFRLYFAGQVFSLHGTWMQNVAQAWLVYRLTGSSVMLGLVAFCSLIPVLLFALFGGVLADRYNRRWLLFSAHALSMLQALVLAGLTLSGSIQPWHIVALALLLGFVHALEMPARHSFIAELVPRQDLPNAVALNSSAFNVARFLGPSLAGVLVAAVGEGWVFAINALSFGAILSALARMRLAKRPADGARAGVRSYVREAVRFAQRQPHIRAGLGLVAMMSTVAAATTVLMPVFAKEEFSGGSQELGLLLGALGLGSLAGALRLAQRTDTTGMDRIIGAAGVVAGLALIAFALLDRLGISVLILVVVGFCHTTLVASTNALIQLLVDDRLRGRVMSMFSTVFIGLMPIGSLVAGTLAQWLGAPWTLALFGMLAVLAGSLFLARAPRYTAQSSLSVDASPGRPGEHRAR